MIPICKPTFTGKVYSDIRKIINSGCLTQGDFLKKFEKKIANYTGSKYSIAVTSATTGLHLCLELLNIGPSDEVLVSDFTFTASGNVVCQVGAKPIFVDCEKDSFLLDLKDLEMKINKNTKAILVVDPFGLPVNATEVKKIAKKFSIPVIDDAACALGSKTKDQYCASWADLSVISFHPRKIITTGEGGMILTDSKKFYDRAKMLLSHGSRDVLEEKIFFEKGYNYRLPEISAALGLDQLRQFDCFLEKRRQIVKEYISLLSKNPLIKIPVTCSLKDWNCQSFVIMLDETVDRKAIIKSMRKNGIETTIGTYALHAQPSFKDYGYFPGQLKNSYFAYKQSLTLPLYPEMLMEDIVYISSKLSEVLKKCEKKDV